MGMMSRYTVSVRNITLITVEETENLTNIFREALHHLPRRHQPTQKLVMAHLRERHLELGIAQKSVFEELLVSLDRHFILP
jgi:hypothetical protein